MARTAWCLVVLCVVVRTIFADGPALVREFTEDQNISTTDDTPLSTDNVKAVVSPEYYLQGDSSLEWLARVAALRGHPVKGMSLQCLEEMEKYWKALQKGEPWASRMFDANGRYSSQLFFGNSFWLGSYSSCNEVVAPNFNVSFRVAKLALTLSERLTPQPRPIFVGLCQPASCTSEDTQTLLKSWPKPPGNETLTVLTVRQVPGKYSVLEDKRFLALSGTILVILCLVIVGTTYDYLNKNKEHSDIKINLKPKGENNNGFISDDQPQHALDIKNTLKQIKIESGKLEESSETRNEIRSNIKSPAAQFFLAFSALANGRLILTVSKTNDGALTSIHGLRFFSLTWVILVHTYLQLFAVGGNRMIRVVTERSFMYQTIGNATFSVDTFFFISGVLVAYLYKSDTKGDEKKNDWNIFRYIFEFIKLFAYRFIRLTPVYLVTLGIVQLSMAYIHNYSVFEPNIMDHYNCENYWWRNILYINNFFPRTEMCMLWSWYLAADTQFFALSAIILLIARRRMKLAIGALIAILLGAWCTTAFISYTNQYQARIEEPFGLFDELYDKPWTRVGPYVVGMGAGWILSIYKQKIKMPLIIVILGWILSCVGLITIVYGLGSGLDVGLSAAYVTLGHTTWGLCLAWIVIACHTGHGGIVNCFLSNPMLFPLSRLTFCAYLVHPVIMVLTSYVMDGPFHMHNGLIVIVFLGNTAASFLLSFLISLGFEAPVVKLLKMAVR